MKNVIIVGVSQGSAHRGQIRWLYFGILQKISVLNKGFL